MDERLDRLSARTGFMAVAAVVAIGASLVAVVVALQTSDEAAPRNDFLSLRDETAKLERQVRRAADMAQTTSASASSLEDTLRTLQSDLGQVERRQTRVARGQRDLARKVAVVSRGIRDLRASGGRGETGGTSARPSGKPVADGGE